MSEKVSYAVFETSSGAKVHRLPLQAFPKFWAYAYVLQKEGGNYLIDTGSGTDISHEDLLKGLKQAGIQTSDLTYILLTHAHIDHYGGLSKLGPLTSAKIGCHELDVQTVAHHDARMALNGRRLASFLAETGLSEEVRDSLLSINNFPKAIYQSVPVDITYGNQDMQVGALEMIHLPGHCPGHVAMRVDDIIFCGDMVVDGITPHLAPASFNPFGGLEHYLKSLARLQKWAQGGHLYLNAHDDVITDLNERIDATRQNLIRRMSRALDALSSPLTIAEACEAVYGGMNGYNMLLVIEKTGAYMEYLYERGMIEITNIEDVEQGLPARYRKPREISTTEILPKEKNYVLV